MNECIRQRIIHICDAKIAQKGETVGISFYAFFKNKNDNPEELFEVAKWWIKDNKFDHFEKATKIRDLVAKLI